MNFSDDQITRYAQEAEKLLATDTRCIQSRVALSISVGVSEYQLPLNVIGITRITWKGMRLDPYSGSEVRSSGTTPTGISQGKPYYYQFSDLGFKVIRLIPAPSETLAAPATDLWATAAISAGCIVQFSCIPDFTSTTDRIPSLIRRQFVKDYVLHRCFMAEGKAMDVKAGVYFDNKFKAARQQNKESWALLHSCIPKVMEPRNEINRFPGRPVLPTQFGVLVDE